jgi:hypothetical protein
MTIKYIGVANANRDSRYYGYASKDSRGVTHIGDKLISATQYDTEQEVIEVFNQSTIWVCRLDGDEITPLQPTR